LDVFFLCHPRVPKKTGIETSGDPERFSARFASLDSRFCGNDNLQDYLLRDGRVNSGTDKSLLRSALPERRWLVSFALALLVVLTLFWIMQRVIRAPESQQDGDDLIEGVGMVQAKANDQPPPNEMFKADAAPPPPPSAPPALMQPNMPTVEMPTLVVSPVNMGNISVPVTLGGGSLSLGKSGIFGGFAGGRGNGSGNGGGNGGGAGYGSGQGFKGKTLIPISTARPQMPEWACKKGIKGWVEVVFTVMPNGRVQDVKIVDADPRGVYEAAAIESISNWIYESGGKAREVKQRVPMDPADCEYNWR
jgi:protein TonB